MTLEFDKIVPQIQVMGHSMAAADEAVAKVAFSAWDRFMALTDNTAIWDQVWIARQHDAGFRGAAPTEGPYSEPFNSNYPLPHCPLQATILAADGSQVYPDPHGPVLYYLTNIAVFVYHHGGAGDLPEPITEPQLYFRDEELHERDGRIIANAAVNARRSLFELQLLARETSQRADATRPLLAIADGPLLFWLGKDVPNAQALMSDYYESLGVLAQTGAALTGYVDQPRSRFVINTLYLMGLDESEITRTNLLTTGDLEGLDDRFLMKQLLGPGERSALLVQQSPQNKAYRDMADDYEIVFFYVNVSAPGQEPYLARVELPMWIAKDAAVVDSVHALLYAQCQLTDRYPYALTRADECAVVHSYEKTALDNMIQIELRRNSVSVEPSQKLSMKNIARAGKQTYQGL
ncbi:MAG: DNA double-strand break repair nuclease NurA [Aggregatilineales bacterium]